MMLATWKKLRKLFPFRAKKDFEIFEIYGIYGRSDIFLDLYKVYILDIRVWILFEISRLYKGGVLLDCSAHIWGVHLGPGI